MTSSSSNSKSLQTKNSWFREYDNIIYISIVMIIFLIATGLLILFIYSEYREKHNSKAINIIKKSKVKEQIIKLNFQIFKFKETRRMKVNWVHKYYKTRSQIRWKRITNLARWS